MRTVYLILYLVAAILFLLTAIGVTHSRLNLVALGLLAWLLIPAITLART